MNAWKDLPWPLVLLLLLLASLCGSPAEAQGVPAWNQCGGFDGENTASLQCDEGLTCTRANDWWWSCLPGGQVSSLCGGLKAPGGGDYAMFACEEGLYCKRWNAWWWDCQAVQGDMAPGSPAPAPAPLPNSSSPAPPVTPSPLPGSPRRQWLANINAEVLILDVGSLRFRGNHPMFDRAPLITQEECITACNQLAECNAVVYCNKANGCGSGCLAYQANNPPAKATGTYEPEGPLPILGFGPWPPGYSRNGCHYSVNLQQHTDQWPHGMCSLKRVKDTTNPDFWSNDPEEGWSSTTIEVPLDCQGVSAIACEACHATSSSTKCLQCAKTARRIRPASEVLGRAAPQMACSKCYKEGVTDQEQCAACLQGQGQCANCVLNMEQSAVSPCLSCLLEQGDSMYDYCSSCATTNNPSRCTRCLGDLKTQFCPDLSETGSPGCIPQWARPCSECEREGTDYQQCVDCAKRSPWTRDCLSCAYMANIQQMTQCYLCAASDPAAASNGACAECMRNPATFDLCLTCYQDDRLKDQGRQWECTTCAARFSEDVTLATKCLQCVRQRNSYDEVLRCIDDA